jgi:predicted tellurium resistance membrane protein TerC
MAELFSVNALASFLALTFLEIVLSVDNILFVAIAAARLPAERRTMGRQLGLWLALALRVTMLAGLVWVTRLDGTLFTIFDHAVSLKDLVLIAGGIFLLYKGSSEIHDNIEAGDPDGGVDAPAPPAGLMGVVLQIGLINIVFSLDSVITAIGMSNQLVVMIAAVTVATLLMMVAFILLVGVVLIADGMGFDMPRGYLYFAIAFSLFVELLNGARGRKVKRRG